ncbi:hypothetical protein [Dactylosporangium sp. CA-139066]|uniref:hypothetical protein n=1 Tax=Dactylosporangium sp. CA-139066 TaxID=3239930 RepID=UPI003D91F85C
MTLEPSGSPGAPGPDEPPSTPEPPRRRGRHAHREPDEPSSPPATDPIGEPTVPPPPPTVPPPPAVPLGGAAFGAAGAPVGAGASPERATDLPGGLRFADPSDIAGTGPGTDEERGGGGLGFGGAPAFPEPPSEGISRRSIALLAAGGLAIIAIAALLVAALSTGDAAPRRNAAGPETPAPVIPVSTDSPTMGAPSASPSSASPRPSVSKTSARPSPSPSADGGARVLSVSVTADPAQFDSCRGTLTTRLTVRMTLSQPGLPVRYTINESMTVRRTASGTSFSETTKVYVAASRGEHQVRIAVSAPSAATATTTVAVDCGR